MSAPTIHTTADGASFRISLIQSVREQSLFAGQSHTFQVEAEGDGEGAAFEVTVRYAPMALAIHSPEERMGTASRAEDLVRRLLDGGGRQSATINVTSDGAAKLGDEVIERIFPLVSA